ncbi:exosortase C-terminal domain/associated protein EpsI [Desulfobacca acetoxidans]|uniref:EpsI family protein n=1 Tax=Desulfobacca acetoxidans (strain ATCC 700848 / DSM 11109 / ASRB2) TaxID=880072 RepID=F2NDF7_DESAR|nr:EpsI domain-containing exosortase [Desulfobacca acetoxidans]AEB10023.1 EpsI family protein [Desulfobacca acetoxidans DSM 11109]
MKNQELGKREQGTGCKIRMVDTFHQSPALWLTLGQVFMGLALLLALGYYLWPALVPLATRIANDDNYSSGLIIPLVIGYITYRKWPELRQPWRPSWWGLAVLTLGFGLFFLGAVLTIEYISQLSLVVLLAGVLWLLGGWQRVKQLSFPLLLLAMVIPLPQFFISKLTLRMQLASSQLAAEMLRLAGYPVALFGNVIDLGDRQLQVVAACSGLGYLFNALGLGVIFCYFFQRQAWKVVLLLLAMIPFAIVGNATRLACIGIWPIFEKGFWHASFGLSIFILGFDYLRGINWLLNYVSPMSTREEGKGKGEKDADLIHEMPIPNPESTLPGPRPRFSSYASLAAGLVLVLVISPFAVRGVQVTPVPLKQSFERFPMQLGPWEGRHVHVESSIVAATGADKVLNADFTNPAQGPVSLWIAYYENQRSRASVHSPMTCLIGSGWKTAHTEVFELAPGKPINFLILDQGGNRMAVYYWYFERGRWLASDYGHKLGIGLDRLRLGRADGALVRLTTPVTGDVGQAKARLDSFLHQLRPILPEFIKDDKRSEK